MADGSKRVKRIKHPVQTGSTDLVPGVLVTPANKHSIQAVSVQLDRAAQNW